MASKALLVSSGTILRAVSSRLGRASVPFAARQSLQQHSSLTNTQNWHLINSRALSCFASSEQYRNPWNTQNHVSKPISSLFRYGNPVQDTVLVSSFRPSNSQVRGYKHVLRPRLVCDGCYFVWRHGERFVECSDHPRHKQIKKLAHWKVWKEDYSKGKYVKAMDWHKKFPREFRRTADRTVLSHNWLADRIGKDI